jgi:transcriptional regulator with XRE-family HTH domain
MTPPCKLDLARLMRRHRVTIAELARRMGLSRAAVRRVRAADRVSYPTYCDFVQAVTGEDVFCRARYDAICRQLARAGPLPLHPGGSGRPR